MLKKTIKPPNPISLNKDNSTTIFLAGSIEMGKAIEWQKEVENYLQDNPGYSTTFNPKRDEWDSSWSQTFQNPQFYQQVSWELNSLDRADIIFMYFDPNTKSPISLLELGLYASSRKMIVCCPEGFWRKGNVDIVCEKYNIPLFNDIGKAKSFLLDKVRK